MQFAIGVSLKHFGRCRSHGTGSVWDSCRKIAWVLKNSFQGISITKFVRKLLNVRSPQTLEFAEITALVPFSTPTAISPTTQHFRDHLRPRIGVSSAAAARTGSKYSRRNAILLRAARRNTT